MELIWLLGRHDDERLPEGQLDLPPQQVEVVAGQSGVHHLSDTNRTLDEHPMTQLH